MADGDERDLLSTPLFSQNAPDPGFAHREAQAAAERSEPHKDSSHHTDTEPGEHSQPGEHPQPNGHSQPDAQSQLSAHPELADHSEPAGPTPSTDHPFEHSSPERGSDGRQPMAQALDEYRQPSSAAHTQATAPGTTNHGGSGGSITKIEVQPSQVVAAAGTAIVAGARMGRLFGRAGWRLARQLPGAQTFEREAQRVQSAAAREVRRLLEIPPSSATGNPVASAEEQRAAALIRDSSGAQAPLRSAMNELLERSVTGSRNSSRDYLFGTIISQLVPDEARILAALAGGTPYAAGDLIARGRGRGRERTLIANASTVGRSVGVGTPDNVPTYLTRLQAFGLIEFGPEDGSLATQYDILGAEDVVRHARDSAERSRQGAVRFVRKTVTISALGRDFWAASDPSRTRT